MSGPGERYCSQVNAKFNLPFLEMHKADEPCEVMPLVQLYILL